MAKWDDSRKVHPALFEFFFWFLALTTIKLLMLVLTFIRVHEVFPNPRELLYRMVGGNFITAIIITLLNRLLQYLLRKRQ